MLSLTELYNELKTDVVAMADPLFQQSRKRLEARDDFLPHAAVLNTEGRVVMLGAMTGSKEAHATSGQIMTLLQNGIRQMSREQVLVAVGLAENVSLTRSNGPLQAIKVSVEHERGLSVALFLPFHKDPEGGYQYGEAFVMPAHPALNLWPAVP